MRRPAPYRGRSRRRWPCRSRTHALDERHLEDLLVHDRPVAEVAVLAEELAVVGGDDHPGVIRQEVEQPREDPVEILHRVDLAIAELAELRSVEELPGLARLRLVL